MSVQVFLIFVGWWVGWFTSFFTGWQARYFLNFFFAFEQSGQFLLFGGR